MILYQLMIASQSRSCLHGAHSPTQEGMFSELYSLVVGASFHRVIWLSRLFYLLWFQVLFVSREVYFSSVRCLLPHHPPGGCLLRVSSVRGLFPSEKQERFRSGFVVLLVFLMLMWLVLLRPVLLILLLVVFSELRTPTLQTREEFLPA